MAEATRQRNSVGDSSDPSPLGARYRSVRTRMAFGSKLGSARRRWARGVSLDSDILRASMAQGRGSSGDSNRTPVRYDRAFRIETRTSYCTPVRVQAQDVVGRVAPRNWWTPCERPVERLGTAALSCGRFNWSRRPRCAGPVHKPED